MGLSRRCAGPSTGSASPRSTSYSGSADGLAAANNSASESCASCERTAKLSRFARCSSITERYVHAAQVLFPGAAERGEDRIFSGEVANPVAEGASVAMADDATSA